MEDDDALDVGREHHRLEELCFGALDIGAKDVVQHGIESFGFVGKRHVITAGLWKCREGLRHVRSGNRRTTGLSFLCWAAEVLVAKLVRCVIHE